MAPLRTLHLLMILLSYTTFVSLEMNRYSHAMKNTDTTISIPNTISKSNTQAVQEEYKGLNPAVQVISNQIELLNTAIQDLEVALIAAEKAEESAKKMLNMVTEKEALKRQEFELAKNLYYEKAEILYKAEKALRSAVDSLNDAHMELSDASNDLHTKEGAYKAAETIYQTESTFRIEEISEFEKIRKLFGPQNQHEI